MKHTLLTTVICALLCATSCHNNKGYEFPKAPEQVFLTEENMPPIEYFTLEKVEVPEGAEMANEYYVYKDTLLIVINNKNPKPYLVSFYNIKTNTFLVGAFKKGIGPGEMLTISPILRNNELYIWDMAQNSVSLINLDSICLHNAELSPSILFLKEGMCYNHIRYDSNSIVGLNIYHFYGFGCEDEPEFINISFKDGYIPPPSDIEYLPENINQRTAYYNSHTHQYFTSWNIFPYIHIYDENFVLQKQFIGPDDYMPEIVKSGSLLLYEEYKSCYSIGSQTENYILLRYNRPNTIQIGDAKYQPREIFCFDKELNLVRRFKSRDESCLFSWMSYSETTDNIYVNVRDENGEIALYKCIFEK